MNEALGTSTVDENKGLYVIFAPTIGNIGGGQLYLSTKVKWLESMGWEVSVYYTDKQPVILPSLKKFENYYKKELSYRFTSYSKKKIRQISIELLRGSSRKNKVVIESYSFDTALWGEYMAKMCGGKHICYLLGERFPNMTDSLKTFLRFKLKQNLLYGITPTNIPSILPEANGESTYLVAAGCSSYNAPEIEDSRLDTIPLEGFTILSIGRLDKPYMNEVFKEVAIFAQKVSTPVNFVVIGDASTAKVRDDLFGILEGIDNLRISFWGYAFPVPRQVYLKADVFVGCAGSANCAYKERVPTITIDANDFKGIGILGETTRNRLYRNNSESPVAIRELLDKIYEEKDKRRKERESLLPIEETPDFSHHLEIIEAPYEKLYYPVENVKTANFWESVIYNTLIFVLGRSLFDQLKKIKK